MNILHLSDIHFGRNYKCYNIQEKFENKEKILEELIDCVKRLGDFRPEHIVVTGDIAWHGKKREYEEAYIWFERLLAATNLKGKDITFCVGNHDVNRDYASTHVKYKDDMIQEIDHIYDYSHVHEMEPPIYEYDRFCEKLGVEPFVYPYKGAVEYSYSIGYKDVKFPSQSVVRLVAFNTALLSFVPEISEDRMWIGQRQVKELMRYGIIPNNMHYTIALFHHAERFLHPNEISEYDGRQATLNLLRKNVDLILCGHTETGGRPVLQQQVGGGKLLTAGAAYFNDEHPNAFSVVCVPDNKKDVLIHPFTYRAGWVEYSMQEQEESDKKLVVMPSLGDIQEHCKLVIKSDDEIFEIPMKKASVYREKKDNVPYIRIDNHKEVLRYLDIVCSGAESGGRAYFSVSLAPKMERNVSAMLEREKYFKFMENAIRHGRKTEFYIEGESGTVISYGNELKGNIDADDDNGIEILQEIENIEKFYDIVLYRPDDLYERDVARIKLLNDLINNGYTDKLMFGKEISLSVLEFEKIKHVYERAKEQNSFCLVYEQEFRCEIFGVNFGLGKVLIIAGVYHVDISDLKQKLDTFMEGDARKLSFYGDKEYKTYFITDRDKAREKIVIEADCELFTVDKIGIDWGYIREINNGNGSKADN